MTTLLPDFTDLRDLEAYVRAGRHAKDIANVIGVETRYLSDWGPERLTTDVMDDGTPRIWVTAMWREDVPKADFEFAIMVGLVSLAMGVSCYGIADNAHKLEAQRVVRGMLLPEDRLRWYSTPGIPCQMMWQGIPRAQVCRRLAETGRIVTGNPIPEATI